MRKSAGATPPIQSLDRGLMILKEVGKCRGPVPIGHLKELLDIDKSSVSRLANTLKRRGFLAYNGNRKDFILGPAIQHLYRQYDWNNMLITMSYDELKMLATKTAETTILRFGTAGRRYSLSTRLLRISLFPLHIAPAN